MKVRNKKRKLKCYQTASYSMEELPTYAPNQGLTAVDYQVSDEFLEFETRFEEKCKKFLKKSKPDLFNESYMDAVIERKCIEEMKYIKRQRCDHKRTIMMLLDELYRADAIKCKRKLEGYRADKKQNKKELEKYRAIYYKGTSLERNEEGL